MLLLVSKLLTWIAGVLAGKGYRKRDGKNTNHKAKKALSSAPSWVLAVPAGSGTPRMEDGGIEKDNVWSEKKRELCETVISWLQIGMKKKTCMVKLDH